MTLLHAPDPDDPPPPPKAISEWSYFLAAMVVAFGGPLAVLWAMILLLENC